MSALSVVVVVTDLSVMLCLAMYAVQRIATKTVTPRMVTFALALLLMHWCVPAIIGTLGR